MAKDYAKKFYDSALWKKQREYILIRDNMICTKCGRLATEVHHITHLNPDNIKDINITLNPDNLTSLCRTCHQDEHKDTRDNYDINKQCIFDENGQLIYAPPLI